MFPCLFPVLFLLSGFRFISIFCFSICQSSRTLWDTTYVFLAGRTPLRVYCSPPRLNSVLTTLTIIVAVSCFRHVNWPGSVQDDYFLQQVNKHRPCCFMAWVDSIDYWQKVMFQLLCCMSPYSVDTKWHCKSDNLNHTSNECQLTSSWDDATSPAWVKDVHSCWTCNLQGMVHSFIAWWYGLSLTGIYTSTALLEIYPLPLDILFGWTWMMVKPR